MAIVYINGTPYKVPGTYSPSKTLADFIRDIAGLKGTKVMCREGGCGACVVAVEHIDHVTGQMSIYAINSCLCPIGITNDWHVTTVEGLGNDRDGLHPLQSCLAKHHATQCGFCTPGVVMSAYSALSADQRPTQTSLQKALDGNLCRCTGYRPIADALKSFATDSAQPHLMDIEDLKPKACPSSKLCTRELLEDVDGATSQAAKGWQHPLSLCELYDLLELCKEDTYRLVFGGTGRGLYRETSRISRYINIRDVKELHDVKLLDNGSFLEVGANVTLTSLIKHLNDTAEQWPGFRYLAEELVPLIEKIGSTPIRNACSWAGNLVMRAAHPEFLSDLVPALEALGAELLIGGKSSNETCTVAEFLSKDMRGKVILSMRLPKLGEDEHFAVYKVMPRASAAHAYVTAAFRFRIEEDEDRITVSDKPHIVYAGIGASFLHAKSAETFLSSKDLTEAGLFAGTVKVLDEELSTDHNELVSDQYKRALAVNLLYKFLQRVVHGKETDEVNLRTWVPSTGVQQYGTREDRFPITEPVAKLTAALQCTGEAQFVGDLPKMEKEAVAVVVTSTAAKAMIAVETSQALALPGIIAVLTAKDIPGKNRAVGSYAIQALADEEVFFYGQPLAVVVAESPDAAWRAAGMVRVHYSNTQDPVVDLAQAIEKKHFHKSKELVQILGSPEKAMAESARVIDGSMSSGAQFHFYLENQTSRCVPTEEGMDVWCSTQHPTSLQASIAAILHLPSNSVNVHVRRLGGGFGGKIMNSICTGTLAALAAHQTHRPVKLEYSLGCSMQGLGKRPEFVANYKVGVDDKGKIDVIDLIVYMDIGYTTDKLGFAEKLTKFLDGPYHIPNWRVQVIPVKTDNMVPSPMRSPVPFPCAIITAHVMDHVSGLLGKDTMDLQRDHLYQNGDDLLCGDIVENSNLRAVWNNIMKTAEVQRRSAQIVQFNKQHKWHKKGLAAAPTQYRIAYQPSVSWPAFVSIYASDGTVAVCHGGVETGQGINVKAAQVAAHTLGITLANIKVKATNSLTGANTCFTAGSQTSEFVCRTVAECCKTLKQRIAPVQDEHPELDWKALIKKCHGLGVDLAAHHKHAAQYSRECTYSTHGVSVAEAEVDILTGECRIPRVDIVMDIGESVNPAIDVGQIEGAFVMGMGLMLSERLVCDKQTGKLLTRGTWDYLPPTIGDIPVDMRVTIMEGMENPSGVFPSKALGEPPICTSPAVLYAVKNAIRSSRLERNLAGTFALDPPATPEAIQKACQLDGRGLKLN